MNVDSTHRTLKTSHLICFKVLFNCSKSLKKLYEERLKLFPTVK